MHEPSPPPYTSSESTTRPQPPSQLATSATAPGGPALAGSYLPYPQNQHLFGPTPLGAQQLNAPYAYYDPRSPYSMTRADARARRRFIASVLWGVAIWCMIGFLLGAEVVEYAKQRLS